MLRDRSLALQVRQRGLGGGRNHCVRSVWQVIVFPWQSKERSCVHGRLCRQLIYGMSVLIISDEDSKCIFLIGDKVPQTPLILPYHENAQKNRKKNRHGFLEVSDVV